LGWKLGGDPAEPSFEDGTGRDRSFHPDLPVAGEAGVRPYVFVERLDETLDKIAEHGGCETQSVVTVIGATA